jgi:hypothetical protein
LVELTRQLQLQQQRRKRKASEREEEAQTMERGTTMAMEEEHHISW